jgi:hypothetical protein
VMSCEARAPVDCRCNRSLPRRFSTRVAFIIVAYVPPHVVSIGSLAAAASAGQRRDSMCRQQTHLAIALVRREHHLPTASHHTPRAALSRGITRSAAVLCARTRARTVLRRCFRYALNVSRRVVKSYTCRNLATQTRRQHARGWLARGGGHLSKPTAATRLELEWMSTARTLPWHCQREKERGDLDGKVRAANRWRDTHLLQAADHAPAAEVHNLHLPHRIAAAHPCAARDVARFAWGGVGWGGWEGRVGGGGVGGGSQLRSGL